jgi:hypothetical protein
MTLLADSEIKDITGITFEEKQMIFDFLKGVVYNWCNNRPDDWFSLRDLLGREHYFWQGTPLNLLYNKQIMKGENTEDAVFKIENESEWLLKKVIHDDKIIFITKKENLVRKYRLNKIK